MQREGGGIPKSLSREERRALFMRPGPGQFVGINKFFTEESLDLALGASNFSLY